jgi:hypothetical protein
MRILSISWGVFATTGIRQFLVSGPPWPVTGHEGKMNFTKPYPRLVQRAGLPLQLTGSVAAGRALGHLAAGSTERRL